MGTTPDTIKRLVEHFDRQLDPVRSPDYNETQLRIDFINPMFRELGWDVDNTQGFAEQYREVVYEDRPPRPRRPWMTLDLTAVGVPILFVTLLTTLPPAWRLAGKCNSLRRSLAPSIRLD